MPRVRCLAIRGTSACASSTIVISIFDFGEFYKDRADFPLGEISITLWLEIVEYVYLHPFPF
jgi:hypothetical protein